MGIELAFLFLMRHAGRLDEIKKHLIASVREMTLAFASSFDIINEAAAKNNLDATFPLAESLFKKADFLIRYACEKLPAPASQTEALKNEVLRSILTVLDEESSRLAASPHAEALVQARALKALKCSLAKKLGADFPESEPVVKAG